MLIPTCPPQPGGDNERPYRAVVEERDGWFSEEAVHGKVRQKRWAMAVSAER